jgi:uncharacterized protein YeaO (DUF488 family)
MAKIIDYLTYRNYAYNRKMSPQIAAEDWHDVYGDAVYEFEQRYQEDLEQRENMAATLLDGLQQASSSSMAISMIVDTLGHAQAEAVHTHLGEVGRFNQEMESVH